MRLVACYITENDEALLELSIKSIIERVDKIYIVYSESKGDDTLGMLKQFDDKKIVVMESPYPHEDKGANGIQRNKYLQMIRHYEKDECFVLVLDSDEVVDDINALQKWLVSYPSEKEKAYNVHMRHFIGDLQHEDSTVERHYCPRRLFYYKPGDNMSYPEKEHPVLQTQYAVGHCDVITIWHLAYTRHIVGLHKKYKNHSEKSTIHSPEFLRSWYSSHAFGQYPRKQFPITDLPKVLLDHFELGHVAEAEYFKNRGLEVKHFVDACHWKDYFKPMKVLMVGDGLGHRSFALATYGIDVEAFDISQWAINHCPYRNLKEKIKHGDLLTYKSEEQFDLVVAYDIMEHIEPDKLNIALKNLYKLTKKHVLFSIPFIGDPNLEADPTHKSKFTSQQWAQKITNAGFTVKEAPEHFLYRQQLLIGDKE